MIEMKYKTRGNSDPHGKPNVLFTCHPSEHEKYFEMISDMFLKEQDCVVFYIDPEEDTSSFDEEDFELQMKDIQLVVIPVTTKLLTNDSFAMQVVFEAAIKNHIPVLPLMMESGLDDVYSKKFGDLEYLEFNSIVNDPTKLPFEERFKKYISSVLVGDDLAKRVRDAFAAYIFMSYRKKDRKYAHELMKMIHNSEKLRDVAIWYDEYLVPGESFNDAIKAALEKSKVFALVVTPSLLEDPNYIMIHEYPAARNSGKEIIPVEMMKTDIKLLRKLYNDMPGYVKNGLFKKREDYIVERLKQIATTPSSTDPEHVFLIGLAYLDGIDVENDNEKAVKLITNAANAGLTEAIRKIMDMYRNGQGVERDYVRALEWHEKLLEQCRENLEKYKSYETYISLFNELLFFGDECKALGRLDQAKDIFNEMLNVSEQGVAAGSLEYRTLYLSNLKIGEIQINQGNLPGSKESYEKCLRIAKKLEDEFGTIESRRDLSICYERIGDIKLQQGDSAGAQQSYEESLKIAKEIEKETGTIESRRDLLISYVKLGDIQSIQRALVEAKESYEESLRIAEEIENETGTIESRNDLSSTYERIGTILSSQGDLPGAKESHELSLNIRKEIEKETGTIESRRNLSLSYERIGNIQLKEGDLSGAKENVELSLRIDMEIEKETGTIESRRDLSFDHDRIGDIQFNQGDLTGAGESYEESLKIRTEIEKETGTIESRRDLTISYDKIGDIQLEQDNLVGAQKSYEESLKIRTEIEKESGTIESRRDLTICYDKIGDIQIKQGDLVGAKENYDSSLKIRKEIEKETGTIESRRDISLSYDRLGDIKLELGDLTEAKEYYEESLKIRNEIEKETGTLESKVDLVVSYYKLGALDSDNHQNDHTMTSYKMITEIVEEYPGMERLNSMKKEIEQYLYE